MVTSHSLCFCLIGGDGGAHVRCASAATATSQNFQLFGRLSDHYESHTSESYESAYFYSEGDYTAWLRDLVRDEFGLLSPIDDKSRDRRTILDVGGGTGNFISMVINDVEFMNAVVVDPFLPVSSDGGEQNNNIQFVKASAEEFIPRNDDGDMNKQDTEWKDGYNHILLKEVVHHLDAKERVGIFTGLNIGLMNNDDELKNIRSNDEDGASLLIITRPQIDIDYPMWQAAKDIWAANQPSADEIEADLRKAGFTEIQQCIKSYPCEITLNKWLDMVRNRFWSTFSHFSDVELDEGCDYMSKEAELDDDGKITFEERLVFITARR